MEASSECSGRKSPQHCGEIETGLVTGSRWQLAYKRESYEIFNFFTTLLFLVPVEVPFNYFDLFEFHETSHVTYSKLKNLYF